LPALAAELVSRGVTVLDAIAGEPAPLAAMRATSTIPIVFMIGGDPVETGLVKSFNRPGGNITGVTILTNKMSPKRLGLLHELVPGGGLIGVLMNPNFTTAAGDLQDVEEAARTIGERLVIANASHHVWIFEARTLSTQRSLWTDAMRLMNIETSSKPRTYCRNPHCRSKLPNPVDNPRAAFCLRGCYDSFYLKRCIVCERHKKRPQDRLCGRRLCRNEYRRAPEAFAHPWGRETRRQNSTNVPTYSQRHPAHQKCPFYAGFLA
jgi:hypothetical protein